MDVADQLQARTGSIHHLPGDFRWTNAGMTSGLRTHD